MSHFTKEYATRVNAIITEAHIFPAFKEGELPPLRFYTQNAAWDTGAQRTVIAPHVAEALELKSLGKVPLMGVGGDKEADVYKVAIALPDAKIYRDYFVYGIDIDDYEILIGMDIISKSDFVITNADGHTVLSFRNPSKEHIRLED